MMAKEYWHCIIGPTEGKELPHGADFPLRMAVKKAFDHTTGESAETCYSGWGYNEDDVNKIMNFCLGLSEVKDLREEVDHDLRLDLQDAREEIADLRDALDFCNIHLVDDPLAAHERIMAALEEE